jgi:1-acyl-sn-glycerol-3-phosphate acyltransferase
VTPEGTRHRVEEWKKGFYFIAQKAEIPILLFGLDYATKRIVCTKSIIPSGNLEEDMRSIKLYFKDFTGRKSDNFTIGNV